MTQGKLGKDILTAVSELGTHLTGYHFDEA